jgi:hypothetical protein
VALERKIGVHETTMQKTRGGSDEAGKGSNCRSMKSGEARGHESALLDRKYVVVYCNTGGEDHAECFVRELA